MLTDRLITRIGSLRGLSPLRMGSFGSVSSAPPGSAKVPAFQYLEAHRVAERSCEQRIAWNAQLRLGNNDSTIDNKNFEGNS
ncbi:unnamed protein product [Caenorhabditis brenneri]